MKVDVLKEAEAELLDATLWYEDRREHLGQEFQQYVLEAIERIAENPERYPQYEAAPTDRDLRRCLLKRFPYVVIFELLEEVVLVIAIAHTSRDSSFWRER